MPSRIDVQSSITDARAAVKEKQFEDLGFRGKVERVAVVDSYVIDAPFNQRQLQRAGKLLANPLLETFSMNASTPSQEFDWAIEIGARPGVTDNMGATAREVIADGIRRKFRTSEGVYYSQVFFVSGKLTRTDAERIAEGIHNPLIQRASVKSRSEYEHDGGFGVAVPRVKLRSHSGVRKVNLEVDDKELDAIGKQGIEDRGGRRACPPELQRRRGPLALDLDAMKAIRDHFRTLKRKPTDVELESLAQTWSEHCKHTIFANPLDEIQGGLFREYIKAATEKIMEKNPGFCVSVFKDNSGAIAFDDEYLITHKVETHNSPSALDPFGGAITGIVGVNRDTLGFGLGAKPVINTYGFCFACPENLRGANSKDTIELFRDKERTQKILSPRRIMDGVVAGVNAGGNCSGIPTPQGFAFFDPRYRAKPGVFVGTVGLIPRKRGGRLLHKKGARPGNYIVMAGGRVGLDGIHGATFSSVALDAGSPAAAVQIGDPITQKKLSDALVKEARDKGLYTSITDNGAGGLSCSVAEMAKEVGLPAGRQGGCRVNLDRVPLKYPGLAPWQIWISESQERMTLAVPKEKWKELFSLCRRRGVEAAVIGEFTDSGRCVVESGGKVVMDLAMEFLHDGWVRRELISRAVRVRHGEPKEMPSTAFNDTILELLARPNIASFAHISSQYDHEVQGGSVTKPLAGRGRVNADATVTKPVLDSKQGVVLAQGLYPTYSDISVYDMAASAIDTAVRAAIAAGAHPERIALLDNFCWCDSYNPERLAQLKDAVRACYDTAVAYETPFISGKDTMFNDFKGFDAKGKPVAISVPPTLLISAIGIVPDVSKCTSLDFKMPGDAIYLLGETHDEIGGSEYAVLQSERAKKDCLGNRTPRVDAERNMKLYRALARVLARGLVASLRDMPGSHTRDDFALFSESQGRVLVSVAPSKCKEFEAALRGNAFARIGTVGGNAVCIRGWDGSVAVRIGVRAALAAYRSTFKGY
ncbi:MAG: phosphoribosylformylglycinamidine synthase [Candidatus Liptonbacteria bacterium]|nr:phosphoribosylformylglycinamidine synthase [Candidatus Liptonbacteria bacterium]